jgi:hypothetical protein
MEPPPSWRPPTAFGPPRIESDSESEISEFEEGSSQEELSPSRKPTERKEYKEGDLAPPPSWGERLGTGLKVVGLSLGVAVGGALAIGLLPFTIIGLVMMATSGSDEKKVTLQGKVGALIAAPLTFGVYGCSSEIDKIVKGVDLFVIRAQKATDMREFSSEIADLKERDLQLLFNKILKTEKITDSKSEKYFKAEHRREVLDIIEAKINEKAAERMKLKPK